MPQSIHHPRSLSTSTYTDTHPLSPNIEFPVPQRVIVASGPTTIHRESVLLSNMESGLASTPTQTAHTYPPEDFDVSRKTWIVSVGRYLFSALCMIYTLGIYRIFYFHLCFKGGGGYPRQSTGYFDSDHAQWLKVVRKMVAIWRLARLGCAVLLPLSITLLQIDGVVSSVFARTCTISTAVFSAAGLICSGIFLFMRNGFIDSKNKNKWIKASREHTSYRMKSIEFWTYLAVPVAAMVWGIVTCVITVVCIAWIQHNDDVQESRGAFTASAVFITCLIALTAFYVYKAAEMAIWSRPSGNNSNTYHVPMIDLPVLEQ